MEKFFWLDTDVGPDCDNAAALAIFLSLAAEGRAIPLGITHCTGDRFGLPMIDAIQRAFGVSLPLGTCSNAEFLKDASVYTRAIAERFTHNFPENQPQPDALCAMRNEFCAVPDGSVTLIGIGPMINLARALQDCETRELFVKKIDRLVLMAGCFGRDEPKVEWNIEMDVPAARIVLEQFPGRIDFCPFEAAADVLTGACRALSDESRFRSLSPVHARNDAAPELGSRDGRRSNSGRNSALFIQRTGKYFHRRSRQNALCARSCRQNAHS